MKSGVNQRFIMVTKKAAVEDVQPWTLRHTPYEVKHYT